MSWLVVTWFLAFGVVPLQTELVEGSRVALDPALVATVAQLGLEATIARRLTLYGDIENFQYFNTESYQTGGAFSPYRVDYTFGARLALTSWLSVEAVHECDHVIKLGSVTAGYESSETKLVVRIEGKTIF